MEILENQEAWQARFREGWLKHLQQTGTIDWELYPHLNNKQSPTGPGIDLAASRLMLITSAGIHLPDQPPFDAASPFGDYSVRLVPTSTPPEGWAISHDHYDHTAINQDAQVALPLGHLADLVDKGVIGELAPSVASFMGYQPDAARVVDETFPAILQAAQAEGVGAALLIPV